MWTSVLLIGATLLAVVEGECYNNEKKYYEELGCKPEALDGGCPFSYDCSSLSQRSQDKCYYQGKAFDKGDKLENSPDTACLAECRCTTTYPHNKTAFSCVNVECPELFNPPPPKGCYRTYAHGKCCHVEEICEDSAQQKSTEPVCEYKGEKYKVGQKFYPDEEPCLTCICQSGYKGEFVEPFCRKVQCNLELQNGNRVADGCVPVYYGEKGCCPIDWRCPEQADSVEASEKSDSKSAHATGKTCKFGELTMHIGDKLSTSSERGDGTECMCRVPPHPVCVQKEST